MKIRWKTYTLLALIILILQLRPFLFIGGWYDMLLYYITYPFADLTRKYSDIVLIAASSLLSALTWSIVIMILAFLLQKITQKR